MRTLSLFVLFAVNGFAQSDALKERMQKFVDAGDLSGAVTYVGTSKGTLHHEAVGFADLENKTPMTRNTLFRIASMTKPMTAIGVMMLVDAGKLSVDDPVEKHLPEFKGQLMLKPSDAKSDTKSSTATATEKVLVKPKRPITVKDLLTHTSGLPTYPAGLADVYQKRNRTLAETTIAISQSPLVFEPGSKWSYCNPGIDTLGRIIEVVSGQKYEDYMAEQIFRKLHMDNTTFYYTPGRGTSLAVVYNKADGKLVPAKNIIVDWAEKQKHPVPAGGLFSTAEDVAAFYRCLLNKTDYGGGRLLSEKSFAEMTKTQTGDLKTGFSEGMSFGYGFGVVVEPKGVTETLSSGSFGHGGAYGTQSWADPNADKFTILLIARTGLSNSDGSEMRKEFQRLAKELK